MLHQPIVADMSLVTIAGRCAEESTMYHDDAKSTQKRIHHCFAEEDTVGHVEDSCAVLVADVFKTNRIADLGRLQ